MGDSETSSTLLAITGLTNSVNHLSTTVERMEDKFDGLHDTVTQSQSSVKVLMEERRERIDKTRTRRRVFWKIAIPAITAAAGAAAAACGHAGLASFFHHLGG